ncbi:MAG TPA: hypothetical protein VMJ31_11885, partial [Methylocystis sp.]|nr:hypothetical protein [Methylocystis sp.]
MTNRKAFFDIIRAKVFHGVMHQRQVDGVNSILEAWDKAVPNADARFVAYALATAHWETAGTMQPIEEYGRGCGHRYGEPAGPCGNCYYGRGFVQLTWLENYQRAEAELHKRSVLKPEESLVENPELALRPDVAAAIMIHGMLEGWFTGHKLADFFHGDCSDWIEARTIINGHNRARQVAGDALHFYAALQAQRKAPAVEPAPGKPEVLKDRKAFFDIVRDKIFHGTMRQRQVDGMNSILEAWEKAAPNADPRFVAYAL